MLRKGSAMEIARVENMISALAGKKILVIGDLMVDRYQWGNVTRICPEAPVPVLEIIKTESQAGGAANVAGCVMALGGDPVLVGVIGPDQFGCYLAEELNRKKIDCRYIVDEGRLTTVKTRLISQNQMILRIDREQRDPVTPAVTAALLELIKARIRDVELVVLSDYDKGLLTGELTAEVISMAKQSGAKVLIDPKGRCYGKYHGGTLITPNLPEAEAATGISITTREGLLKAGQKLLSLSGCESVLITRGAEGLTVFERQGKATHIPAVKVGNFNVVGAGDTLVAALAVTLANNVPLLEAAYLAVYAAGVAVGKFGTATATWDEVRALARQQPLFVQEAAEGQE